MYDSGPEVRDGISLPLVGQFLSLMNQDDVNAFGLYGGEPWLCMRENTRIIEMLPPGKPVFVITNGTWSKGSRARETFLGWARDHDLYVVVSGTAEHVRHQDRAWLEEYATAHPGDRFRLKEAEAQFISMGRLGSEPSTCRLKCETGSGPTRIAMKPSGEIIFQTCDGQYPVIGHASEGFQLIQKRLDHKVWMGCRFWCRREASQRYSV